MTINDTFGVSYWLLAFVALAILLIGGLFVSMRLRHQYSPNLIGALIGALCCFLLLEALPSLL
jgi:uncharacterized membrane protein YfcA